MERKWKLVELLNWTADYLGEKGFEGARLNAERLLAHALGMRRIDLYLNFDRPLTPNELSLFKGMLQRRLRHEPLQYILESAEFYSIEFTVKPGTLIPRPETEILIERSLARRDNLSGDTIEIVDIGTGCGNLAITLAHHLRSARILAIDISENALDTARENAARHGVEDRIVFQVRDACAAWPEQYNHCFDILVCNPPYIRSSDYQALPREIRDFEPESALLAGESGLEFYQKFAHILPLLIAEAGLGVFEIGSGMSEPVSRIFEGAGFSHINICKDLAGLDRAIEVSKGAIT